MSTGARTNSANALKRSKGVGGEVLGRRALNRALLERQMLLRRSTLPIAAAIEQLVGLQAQAPNPPYVGLWTRLRDFRPDQLAQLITGRQVVRIALMRGTIHLVTARDCLALRPLLQPVLDRAVHANGSLISQLAGVDLDTLVADARALLDQHPLTNGQLSAGLKPGWPKHDPAALTRAIRSLAPLVQVPPRGIWGAKGQAMHTTAETWLGRSLETNVSLDHLVLRYLAAFGPASVMDVQAWSGLTGLGEIIDRLRPKLVTFRDESGRALFDLPEAPRPDPAASPGIRFLPEFDNVLLAHGDRTRIISDDNRKRIYTVNGLVPGTVLVDGFVGGKWTIARRRGVATLIIEPFRKLSKNDRSAIIEEGSRLLSFAAGKEVQRVQLIPSQRRDLSIAGGMSR
jgi:hypothetical protein